MAANLTLYMCRDCGVTIPDGRGWFVWPGFPADGSPPLGVGPPGSPRTARPDGWEPVWCNHRLVAAGAAERLTLAIQRSEPVNENETVGFGI